MESAVRRTRNAVTRRHAWLAAPAAAVLAALALSGPAAAATPLPPGATTYVPTQGTTSQGIIMRDGGICDPIRHMGC